LLDLWHFRDDVVQRSLVEEVTERSGQVQISIYPSFLIYPTACTVDALSLILQARIVISTQGNGLIARDQYTSRVSHVGNVDLRVIGAAVNKGNDGRTTHQIWIERGTYA